MTIDAANSELKQIKTDLIERNIDNPRIIFRQSEFDSLLDSINRYGIQVPISVYRERGRYVLIDGERRWKCSQKLNMQKIPALIQDKPDKLTNLLLMFNIHALREQWDLLTIALKLKVVIELLEKEHNKQPSEIELSKHTGMARGVIRRCKLLLGLPDKYQSMILDELKKPKSKQKLTEDFFIEMERALKTVERAMSDVVPDKDSVRKVLIKKFENEVINNRVHFRDMAKIARAENVNSDISNAKKVLKKLFKDNNYSIQEAFMESVSEDYSERDILTRLNQVIEKLSFFKPSEIDDEIRSMLRKLSKVIKNLLDE